MDISERTTRFFQSTIDFAVIHTSLEGEIQAWLGAAERVLGYSADEALGMSLTAFFTPEDRRRSLDLGELAVALSTGRSEDDRWHVRKDGTRFWASGVLSVVQNDEGQPVGLCKVLRDKTDVRTQLESLESIVANLKSRLESNQKTVASLAHELRNPMTPIVFALRLLHRPNPTPDVVEKVAKIVADQVGVLKHLLNDLSALAIEAASPFNLQLERVNLSTTLRETVDGLLEPSRQRAQVLLLVLPAADIWIAADSTRLQQMLMNLLSNALKYTPGGGHINVTATIEADMAVVRVEDDGVGIAPEILPRIFDLFTREDRHSDIAGQGIGLAVVKQLATAHGGFIEARSQGQDKGASFSLRLPLLRESS
jgi:PAS domain S-box-containing protein